VKYILSSYYQGTKYNPYTKADYPEKGIYRPIGISRTGVMAILQIRGYMPEALQGIEWICFGANPFNTVLPVYANVDKMPKYLSDVTLDTSTENFYWASRLLGALADPNYGTSIQFIERYQNAVPAKGRALVNEYDRRFMENSDPALLKEANEKLATIQEEGERLLVEAKAQQKEIISSAMQEKQKILQAAQDEARTSAQQIVDDATARITAEKEKALREVRSEVAALAIDIAEKVLSRKMSVDAEQKKAIDRLIEKL
jgi:ATP synthase F0 subunit b